MHFAVYHRRHLICSLLVAFSVLASAAIHVVFVEPNPQDPQEAIDEWIEEYQATHTVCWDDGEGHWWRIGQGPCPAVSPPRG